MNKRIFSVLCCLLIALFSLPALALTILEEGPDYETGLFEQTVSDIDIKVLGGEISFTRKLKFGRWYFNPSWSDIKYKKISTKKYNPDTGSSYYEHVDDTDYIQRNSYWYKLDENSDGTVYRYDDEKKIVKTDDGLRWSDRSGSWIEYDLDGKLKAFGNTLGKTVEFVRNQDGYIDRIIDRNGLTLLTVIFEGNKPASVQDYSGRKVIYKWQNNNLSTVTDVMNKEWVYSYQMFGTLAKYNNYDPMQTPPKGGTMTMYVDGVRYKNTPLIAISGIQGSAGRTYSMTNTYIAGNQQKRCWTDGTPKIELIERIDPDTGLITIEEKELNVPGKKYCKNITIPAQVITGAVQSAVLGKNYYSFSYNEDKKSYGITNVDADGVRVTSFYSVDGVITKQLKGDELVFTQAKVGKIKKIADADGNITTSTYDDYNNIIKVQRADGSVSTAEFHPSFNYATRIVNENGVITEAIYSDKGLADQKIQGKGLAEQVTTIYAYNTNNLIESVKMSGNSATKDVLYEYEYDEHGNMKRETINSEIVWQYLDFNALGQAKTVIDGRGKSWFYEYDNLGRLTKETDPLNHSVIYNYDDAGNLEEFIDAKKNSFTAIYNNRNQLTSSTDAYQKTRFYTQNASGIQTEFKDELGKIFSLKLDRAGRPQSRIDGNNIETKFSVGKDKTTGEGSFEDLTRVDYPTYSQLYKYNSRKQISQLTIMDGAQGTTYNYQYDPLGQLIAQTDPNGHSTYYTYDAFGNLTKEDSSGFITESEYNSFGDLIRFTDRNGYVTELEYDVHGRLSKKSRLGFGEWNYGYDNNDNLISLIDPNGQKLVYVYDDANRQTAEHSYAQQVDSVAASSVTYGYDDNDQLISWESGSLSGSSVRDNNGRLTSSTTNYGSFSKTYQYSYYDNGTLETLTMPDGSVYSYQYDNNNQLTRLQIPGEGSVTVNEFNWLAPSKETLPGGVVRDTQYTGLLNTEHLEVTSPGGQSVLKLGYDYGLAQEILGRDNDGTKINYVYDDIYRLQQATSTLPTGEVREETYLLDANSNRIETLDESNWVHNTAGQLKERGSVSYDYDSNGNQVKVSKTDSQLTFIYDAKDRLIRVEDANAEVVASYQYDPFDRRLSKTVNSITTYYLYNSNGLIAEYNQAGQELNSYGYRPNSIWGTNPVFLKTGEQSKKKVYYYQNDQLGTPYKLTDNTGFVVWQTQFDSFGNALLSDKNLITNNLRFPGQYFDAETGLHYNWRRYYDPVTGRYITPDPIDLAGGPNLYAYVDGDPINRIDPNGECAILGVLSGVAFEGARSLIMGDCFSYTMTDAVGDAFCGAGKLLKAAKYAKKGKKSTKVDDIVCPINSFTPETLVHSENGLVEIQTVKEGDKLLSYAEWDGSESYQTVTEVRTNTKVQNLFLITLESGETIEATDLHPFYIVGTGWVEAQYLKLGDPLYRGDKGSLSIAKIDYEQRQETVYNFSVANTNTYFVGIDKVLVHNAKSNCSKNAIELRKDLVKHRRGPLINEDAAHIVASGHWRHAKARKILKDNNIDINSALNGVGLPSNTKVPNPYGKTTHNITHRYKAMDKITNLLVTANRRGIVKSTLKQIQKELTNGTFKY